MDSSSQAVAPDRRAAAAECLDDSSSVLDRVQLEPALRTTGAYLWLESRAYYPRSKCDQRRVAAARVHI